VDATFTVWLDGVKVMDLSGLDTKQQTEPGWIGSGPAQRRPTVRRTPPCSYPGTGERPAHSKGGFGGPKAGRGVRLEWPDRSRAAARQA
jgi:hypothetical protein